MLDDWCTLRGVALDGAWHAGPDNQVSARLGAALPWVVQFGAFGRHPLPGVLLRAALVALAASLLHRVLLLVVPAGGPMREEVPVGVAAAATWTATTTRRLVRTTATTNEVAVVIARPARSGSVLTSIVLTSSLLGFGFGRSRSLRSA